MVTTLRRSSLRFPVATSYGDEYRMRMGVRRDVHHDVDGPVSGQEALDRRNDVHKRGAPAPKPQSQWASNFAVKRNKQIVELGKRRDWVGILMVYEQTRIEHRYTNVNFATTMSRLGQISNVDRQTSSFQNFVEELATVLEAEGMKWMGMRQAYNIVHAIAKMGLQSAPAKRIVEFVSRPENVQLLMQSGDARGVANVCWSLAKLGRSDIAPPMFREVETHSNWFVEVGNPLDIANTTWASATLGMPSPRLFNAVETRADQLVEKGSPQNVANTAWACAKVGLQSPKLFAAIEARAEQLVEKGRPQEISNTAWACATLGVQSSGLFAAIETHAESFVETGKPQEISNTAWACATLRVQSPTLFAAIEEFAVQLVENGKPQEVANTIWACAILGIPSPKLFAAMEERADRLVGNGNPQDMANSSWACATRRILAPKLFEAIDERAVHLVENGSPQDVANTVWACATLGIQSPALFAEIEHRASQFLEKANAQDMTNTAWACAILNVDSPTLFSAILSRCPEDWSDAQLVQLAQTAALASVDGRRLCLSDQLEERILHIPCSDEHTMSGSQQEVCSLLREFGIESEMEVSPIPVGQSSLPRNMLTIDVALVNRMVAVEFDGPSHFLRSVETGEETRVENGPTRAKQRFLESVGWHVIRIHHQDWKDEGTEQAKIGYLRNKLTEAAIDLDK